MVRYQKIVFIASAVLLWSCSESSVHVPSGADAQIALLSTRASGGVDTQYRPVFLFWELSKVAGISQAPYAVPFHISEDVPKDANAYQTVRYNTQRAYPSDFSALLATGYIPQDLVPASDGNGGKRYHELMLPVAGRGAGRTVLMAPKESLIGSLLNPFDTSGQQLVFKHLQSMIHFRAICSQEFPSSLYVDKVQITVGAADLVGGIRWDSNNRTYAPMNNFAGADLTVGQGCEALDGQVLPLDVLHWYDSGEISGNTDNNTYSEAGDFYILPNRSTLTLKEVSCRMYPSDEELNEAEKDAYRKVVRNVVVDFEENGNSITLLGGESHRVTLYFARDGIELSGRKAAWEHGGNITIPVEP